MKAADFVLLAAAGAAVFLMWRVGRDQQAASLAIAKQNAQRYGGSVNGWMNYEYIDNDPIPGITIPGAF